jgi:hypothetical protein
MSGDTKALIAVVISFLFVCIILTCFAALMYSRISKGEKYCEKHMVKVTSMVACNKYGKCRVQFENGNVGNADFPLVGALSCDMTGFNPDGSTP